MKKKLLAILGLWILPVAALAVSLENPINAESIPELINTIIKALLGVAGAISLFYLVWGGIIWMTSAGNADRVKKGKDTLVWAIFGLGVIFFSYAMVRLVFQALGTE